MNNSASLIKHSQKYQNLLILICSAVYTMSQIGRYSYSSSVTLIIEKYGVDHAAAGLPTTFYFFAYGIGQIVVGFLVSKFRKRYVLTGALLISCLSNILIYLNVSFDLIKYIWGINGFAQSLFWPSLLFVIGQNIEESKRPRAALLMAASTSVGTFISYGISALLSATKSFEIGFLIASVAMAATAVMWFLSSGSITENLSGRRSNESEIKQSDSTETAHGTDTDISKRSIGVAAVTLVLLFAVFGIINDAVRVGLRSWVPSILKEVYGLEDWLSIFMSVFLPLSSIFTAQISVSLQKRIPNFVLSLGISFAFATLTIGACLMTYDLSWIILFVLFIVISMTLSVCANILTVQVPLYLKGSFNSGFLAGFINGACYIGSAIATYGFGGVADKSGWSGVFILMLCLIAVNLIASVVYLILKKKNRER